MLFRSEKCPSSRSRIGVRKAINHANATINRTQDGGIQIGRAFASREIGTNCVARNGRKTELFWGKIDNRASASRHFLRIGFWIIPILSNAYCVIRPICVIFRLVGHCLIVPGWARNAPSVSRFLGAITVPVRQGTVPALGEISGRSGSVPKYLMRDAHAQVK